MEELLAGILGGAVVFAAGKSDFFRGALKGLMKMGYAVSDKVTSCSGETAESVKDLLAESKSEYEAAKAANAEAKVHSKD